MRPRGRAGCGMWGVGRHHASRGAPASICPLLKDGRRSCWVFPAIARQGPSNDSEAEHEAEAAREGWLLLQEACRATACTTTTAPPTRTCARATSGTRARAHACASSGTTGEEAISAAASSRVCVHLLRSSRGARSHSQGARGSD
eukprot:SAG11_NODE_7520_length_1135_cov_1.750000_1_plen_145_part_00